ncbi:MAG: NAD(P)H-dependent oxidoreductase subunit E [Chloroflexi bacterium]|nr:NAD(P)H-dependent oxidoreductase subunit E [Chloroflexota bacterium]
MKPVTRARIADVAGRYPTKRAALLPALWAVQEEEGWVSAGDLEAVAHALELAPADAEGVASFYSLFHRSPPGRTVIDVCDNFVCQQNGAEALLEGLCRRLAIRPGDTTPDGRVTVRRQECIAACHQAPAVQVNLEFRGPVTDADALLREIA